MEEKNNIKDKISYYLSRKYRIKKSNKKCFEKYLKKKLNCELEIIYTIFENTHTSYRMSYDNILWMIIGASITMIITFFTNISFLIDYKLLIIFLEIILILLLSFLLLKLVESNNLKKKKECITDEIIKRIDNEI